MPQPRARGFDNLFGGRCRREVSHRSWCRQGGRLPPAASAVGCGTLTLTEPLPPMPPGCRGGVPDPRRVALHGSTPTAVPARQLAGPARVPAVSDDQLAQSTRRVLTDSPLAAAGRRPQGVPARLCRQHRVNVSGKQVLRAHGLLAPQRARGRRRPRPHDGTIIPAASNLRWGTDATMAWTRTDGWVRVFACVGHYTAEAWAHVAKVGDRFAALQP
jgi:hypothetical protein